jgi:copper homeostasis protein
MITLEVCVDSPAGLAAAIAGGADRIELCAALELGGLTPSPGLIAMAAECGVPVVAMIRLRPGDFICDAGDLDAARRDIDAVRAAGLAGVVIGASRADGRLDEAALARLVRHAGGLDVVLHRAFDLAPDPSEALEAAIGLGIGRILTSGGATRAPDGLDRLAAICAQAGDRIAILPGSGITAANVGQLLARLPVREVHASCAGEVAQDAAHVALGFANATRKQTDAAVVRAMKAALNSLA